MVSSIEKKTKMIDHFFNLFFRKLAGKIRKYQEIDEKLKY